MAENIFDTLTPEDAIKMAKTTEPDAVQNAINSKENTFDVLEREQPIAAKQTSGLEAAGASIGKGVVKGAQGIENLFELISGDSTDDVSAFLGLPSSERQEKAFEPLREEFPITTTVGEIAGEIAATAPIGAGVGSAALKGVNLAKGGAAASRFIPALAAGATEGSIIGAAEEDAGFGALIGGGTAVAAEALLPPVARRLKRFFGKAKPLDELVSVADGVVSPTKETLDVLDDVGVKFDDIITESQEELLTPKQAAIKGAFKKEGIEPASRTRIRPNVEDIQREGFLLRQSGSEGAASDFRQKVVQENEALKGRFEDIANEVGISGEQGADKLKTALFDIKSSMRSARNRAYQDLADVAQDKPELIKRIPLNKDRLVDGVREASEIGVDPSTENAVLRAFEDFGLVEKGERKGAFDLITGESGIEDLSLANLHKFRKRINSVFDVTKPKEVIARKSIINAIDDIELEIVDAFDDEALSSVKTPKLIRDAAVRARQSVIDEKKVFNEGDLIQQLVAPKVAGLDAKEAPLVASSKVFNKITTKATPVENVRKLVSTLKNDGSEESLEALGNLQASTMMDLLDFSVQPSKKLVDKQGTTVDMFSGTRLNNRIKQIGEDKINALFDNNKDALRSLKRLRKISDARITPEEAIQKGSLPPSVLNTLFDTISKSKGVPVVGGAGDIAEKIQSSGAAKKVTSFKPSDDDLIDFIVLEGNPRLTKLLEAAGKYTPTRTAATVTATEKATEKQD